MFSIYKLLIVCILVLTVNALVHTTSRLNNRINSRITLNALGSDVTEVLNEIKSKYSRISNVVSPESEAEASKLKETVDKYDAYLEVKKMMTKLRSMYVNEASDKRKQKQLKSFIELYKGKVELEEILRIKAGFPAKPSVVEGLPELEALTNEIQMLEKKLEEVKVRIPEGQSTRLERFGY